MMEEESSEEEKEITFGEQIQMFNAQSDPDILIAFDNDPNRSIFVHKYNIPYQWSGIPYYDVLTNGFLYSKQFWSTLSLDCTTTLVVFLVCIFVCTVYWKIDISEF